MRVFPGGVGVSKSWQKDPVRAKAVAKPAHAFVDEANQVSDKPPCNGYVRSMRIGKEKRMICDVCSKPAVFDPSLPFTPFCVPCNK